MDTLAVVAAKGLIPALRFLPRRGKSAPFPHAMSKPKVLVADPIAQRGIDELAAGGSLEIVVKLGLNEDQLIEIIGEFAALVVRSETKASAKVIEAAHKLK